jgi:glycyl-tRNA synthetase
LSVVSFIFSTRFECDFLKIDILKHLKERQSTLEKLEAKKEPKFNRAGLEDLAKRRFFFAPAFEIYGGVAG